MAIEQSIKGNFSVEHGLARGGFAEKTRLFG